MSRRVLITGAAGLIGGILRKGLAEDFELTGVDRRRVRGSGLEVADTTRLRSIARAVKGQDAVVDLAADPRVDAAWEDVHKNNLLSVVSTLEAARLAGVKRVVYASSNHVTGVYERKAPYSAIVAGEYEGLDPASIRRISAADPIRPDGPYGVSKAFGEAAGRYYADEHGLCVICLRIGTVNESGRPEQPRHFATLLTHDDLVQLIACCLRAPENLRFAVFYGVSANTWRFWEIEDAAAAIGYRPTGNAETWR